MQKAKLLIGKNSWILRNIDLQEQGYVIISHTELHSVDLDHYGEIWIFSWSHKIQQENIEILNKLPLDRCVFVSSTAVLSVGLRRQWNSYPNCKLDAENIVLRGGGRVVRFGVISPYVIARSVDRIPVTTFDMVRSVIVGELKLDERVTTFIETMEGGYKSNLAKAVRLTHLVARIAPQTKFVQVILESITKYILRSATYGYSADSALFFCDDLQVGFGVLGAALHQRLHSRGLSTQVIYSAEPNERLTNNGFQGTRIGLKKNGLAAFWHGVFIEQSGQASIKRVPFFVRRHKPPCHSFSGTVAHIEYTHDHFNVYLKSDQIASLRIQCSRLFLAAGPVENVRILQSLAPVVAKFSDHEIFMAGTVSCHDPLVRQFLKCKFGFVWGRKVYIVDDHEIPFLVDLRPVNSYKHINNSENLYDDTTNSIVFKLIRRFSLSQINEAIFNKLGFSIWTQKLSVFIQAVSKDCITMSQAGELSRIRLTGSDIKGIQMRVAKTFKTFSADESVISLDGQHVMGGAALASHDIISKLQRDGCLFIAGSPTEMQLGPAHHTFELKEKIRAVEFK